MEDGIINISELKPGQKFSLEIGSLEPVFTKLEEPHKFTMEDWFDDEVEIYIIEDKIEEDEPLHYAFEPMTLEEGFKELNLLLDKEDWKLSRGIHQMAFRKSP